MTLSNRIRRWWYWRQMAKIDQQCRRHGHIDSACWAVTGATGNKCMRCGRIIWFGHGPHGGDYYQGPTRIAEGNWP